MKNKRIKILIILLCLSIFSILSLTVLLGNKKLNSKLNEFRFYIDNGSCNKNDYFAYKNDIYISKNCLNNNRLIDIHWDKDYNKISIFHKYNYYSITYDSNSAYINSKSYNKKGIFYIKNDELYINISYLKDNFIKDIYISNKNNKFIISSTKKIYNVNSDTIILNGGNNSKKIKIKRNSKIHIYNYSVGNYVLCRTSNNYIGFIDSTKIIPYSSTKTIQCASNKRMDEITLSWDLQSKQINDFKQFDIPDCIDILAPTWFELEDNNNFFNSIDSKEYIDYVHSKNKKVWATFNNSFNKDLTHNILSDAHKRSLVVDRIIDISLSKKFDGINIDFENVYMKDRQLYNVFIQELYCKVKVYNIPLSVDIAVLSNSETWSKFADRYTLGQYCDYLILMAYDQNVSGKSGSVGSIPWIEYGVKNLLESVDNNKVVLAVPFYTRLWEESYKNNELVVKSTSLKISSAKKLINKLGIKLSYDEKTGQNYGKKVVDGVVCKIWNEDTVSLKNRLKIVKKYNLVGRGVWALSYGTPEMWEEFIR